MTKNLQIYYGIYKDDDDEAIVVTEKNFYDTNRRMDDGEGQYYDEIENAFIAAGAECLADSTYGPNTTDIPTILRNVRAMGYNLIRNPAME